jgi:hypothetical protein
LRPAALVLLACASVGSAADFGFYDADNSCSLGCGCDWTIAKPKHARIYRARHPQVAKHDDDVVFNESLLVGPGARIEFILRDVPARGINFDGFSIEAGSCDGRADCTLPRDVEILVNGIVVGAATLKRTREPQSVPIKEVIVRNGDRLGFAFRTGYVAGKAIGFTYLAPDGAH